MERVDQLTFIESKEQNLSQQVGELAAEMRAKLNWLMILVGGQYLALFAFFLNAIGGAPSP